ncbi:MAG: hypothetical protein ACOCXI_09270 [Chloroflexota bacterium]
METTSPGCRAAWMPAIDRRYWLIPLFWLIFLTQLPPYADSFLLDDYKHLEYVQRFVQRPWRVYEVFSPFWIGWYYRPFQHVLILTNRLLFEFAAPGYYVMSAALHCINVALLYRLGRRLRLTAGASLLAATLFSVHWLNYDALGWISSSSVLIAAAFSLLSLLCFTRYLRQRGSRRLAGALLAAFCALLAREESVVLPVLLLTLWLWRHRNRLRAAPRGEWLPVLGGLLGLGFYFYFQMARPTWTTSLDSQIVGRWWQATRQGEPFHFLFRAASFLVVPSLPPSWPSLFWQKAAGLILALGGALWWWRSRGAARLALAWAGAVLVMVYLLVWAGVVDVPALAPRYLYAPWIGLSLGIGATYAGLRQRLGRPTTLTYAVAAVCLLFVAYQATRISASHQNYYTHTRYMQEMRRQLQSLVGEPGPDAHFFAHEFPSTPDYIQAMASVWYEQPFPPPGGDLGRLLVHGRATDDFYVLTHEQGRLYNLMPELQESEETVLAWDREPLAQRRWDEQRVEPLAQEAFVAGATAGPPHDRRLALALEAGGDGWRSLAYERTVPDDARLRFSILLEGEGKTNFRLRLQPENSEPVTLFEAQRAPADFQQGWEQIALPVEAYWGERVTLFWEVMAGEDTEPATAYWANPRFVIGDTK